MISLLAIMTILLAVLGLVVVKALAESPWGLFTIAMTIPLALIMGVAHHALRRSSVTGGDDLRRRRPAARGRGAGSYLQEWGLEAVRSTLERRVRSRGRS